jgi:Rod binding domain-containing protein
MSIPALPPVDRTALPADIRDGSPERRMSYTAALGFERMLVAELAKSLSHTAKDDDESADAATSTYRDQLPGALADGIIAGGGLGLARQLVPAAKETKR